MSDARPTTLTITFDEPITVSGKTFAEVTLREPTSDEYDQASGKPGFGLVRHLMVVIGKMTPAAAALVPVSKAREADTFIAGFLRPAPPPPEPEPEAPRPEDAAIFDAMVLREPTVAELEVAGVGPRGTAKLVSLVAGIPYATALRMPISVSARADGFFADFVPPSPATGRN